MNRNAPYPVNSNAGRSASPYVSIGRLRQRLAPLALIAVLTLSSSQLFAESAAADFKQGQLAEARENYDAAYTDYQRAYQKNPKDIRFRTALDRVRVTASTDHVTKGRKLLEAGNATAALSEFLHAAEIDPGNESAQQEIAKARQQQGLAPKPATEALVPQAEGEQAMLDSISAPAELKPLSNEPLTLHMSEDAKVVYQAIGKAAGINVLFDPDYTSKRTQVDLNNVSLTDALRVVGAQSGTFWKPITSNSIFVAQNTRVKHTELDVQAVQTFYLTNAWQQNDLNDVQTALRNVLPNAKVYGVASQNAIVMRGTPDELLLAEKLINDLDKPRSEVVVDIGVLEVSKNWEKTLGISWPSSVGVALTNPTTTTTGTTGTTGTVGTTTTGSSVPSLYQLAHLNANDFAVTVGSATLNALLTDDNTQILQDPRIRATDGQKATLTIGSKIPIATGSYQTGAATALVSSLVNTQFQFIDVGVKVEMTPTVHFDDDVTLKVHIEVSSESGTQTISGVTEPILSQRIVDQVIRLKEGEASILGGIENKQESQNSNGIPGLSQIPILRYLFGSRDHTIQNDEIVFVVVPHVVRSQTIDQQNLRAIDTGEGQTIELRHDGTSAPAAQPAPRPVATARPNVGTVQANSAPAAANAALAQMRSAANTVDNPTPLQQTPQTAAALQSPFEGRQKQQGAASVPAASAASVTAPTPRTAAGQPAMNQPTAAGAAPVPIPGALPSQNPNGPAFDLLAPSGMSVGESFQVPISIHGGTNVSSVPLHVKYDATKLNLINVTNGDYLSKDGQAVALVHRDDGPGDLNVVASRPPGAAGVTGEGVVCVLSFQSKVSGGTTITITQAAEVDSSQQTVEGPGSQVNLMVK